MDFVCSARSPWQVGCQAAPPFPVAIQKGLLFAFVIITNRISLSACLSLNYSSSSRVPGSCPNICPLECTENAKLFNQFYSRQGIQIRPRTRRWRAISLESTESSLAILKENKETIEAKRRSLISNLTDLFNTKLNC